ncbi:hypothetical protein HAX54_027983 [Datura stramonium]|uniref:GDSL esterase/lipase n=1 Tax=Datura stramonium TaxID=4076 RepID=A0ABS8S948_DATST|nr:hypothetical protein [Datura stramonium]
MENKFCFICCLWLCLFTYMTSFPAVDMIEDTYAVKRRQHGKHKHGDVKLFVFGDSYVDTGNWPTSMSSSWKEPYGFTYPGSPSGRFSDGLDLGNVTKSIMSQLELNLRRIHGLGVQKIGITAMEPIGCLPKITAVFSSYENCSESANSLSILHNQMLHQTIDKLNNQTGRHIFFILDLYNAFMSALDIQQNHPAGNSNFENPLKPCCMGTSSEYSCGDKKGMKKKYVLCKNPEFSFFWDVIHPSQQGWFAVFSALKPSLNFLL